MTVDAIEAIMTTRAIRRFTDEPVSDDDLLTCLRAAQQAPSGGNVQPQRYVVVTDPDVKARVGEWYRRAFARYSRSLPDGSAIADDDARATWERGVRASWHLADHFGDAPAIVVFLQAVMPWAPSDDEGPMDIGRLDASVYPAVQNFCVAARALGLGTALTTVARIHTAEIFAVLAIPEGKYEIAAMVPVGRPAGNFGVARRHPVENVTHWNAFGTRRAPA